MQNGDKQRGVGGEEDKDISVWRGEGARGTIGGSKKAVKGPGRTEKRRWKMRAAAKRERLVYL